MSRPSVLRPELPDPSTHRPGSSKRFGHLCPDPDVRCGDSPSLDATTLGRLGACAVVAMLLGLGGCRPTYLEDLPTPALVWTQGNGLCSKIVAVDAARVVRVNQGCEDGRPDLHEVRTATQAQVDTLWSEFEMLPLGPSATPLDCAGLLHTFERWQSQSHPGASACGGSPSGYDDVATLPEAFQPLAQSLRDLE